MFFKLPALFAAAPAKANPDDLIASTADDLLSLPDQAEELTRQFYRWFRADSLDVLIGAACAFALYSVLVFARTLARNRLEKVANTGSWNWILLKILARTRSYFLATLAAQIFSRLLGAPPALAALVHVLFTIGAVVQGAFWVRELLIAMMERRLIAKGDDPALGSAAGVVSVIINVIVWALAAIILLDNLGVNVTALVAGLGIGGIAIGLAAQGIFSDLFAALSILLDQPFRKGDSIQVGDQNGISGTVEQIGLKTTRIRALSGEVVVMSNANLLNQQIHNMSAHHDRRVAMVLEVIYQIAPDILESIPQELERIVKKVPHCHFVRANFTNFSASGIDFELIFMVHRPDIDAMVQARQAVAFAINRRFQELDIEFAYPTQTSFTVGPDGRAIWPYADPATAPAKNVAARS